jgi:hypothetical protein
MCYSCMSTNSSRLFETVFSAMNIKMVENNIPVMVSYGRV